MSTLSDHMATGAATVCRAWIVRRTDGVVLGFTDHDDHLMVEGVSCAASSGLTAGALETSTGMSVDNTEAQGALSDAAIRADDIRAGLWDDAEITAYLVNWTEASTFEILFRGKLGEISWGNGKFSAELRGFAEELNKTRGRIYQKRCDAILGDVRCGKALDARFMIEADVISVDSNQAFAIAAWPEYAARWFEHGEVSILTGSAAGLSGRLKTDRVMNGQRKLALWQQLRLGIGIGDRIRLQAGCDKRMATCRLKFNNILNFRGFPNIPGEDWLMAYPTSGSRNDGSSL